MQPADEGGIAICVAAEQPEGVREENWLPIERQDRDLAMITRIYAPDFESYEVSSAPEAKRVDEQAD